MLLNNLRYSPATMSQLINLHFAFILIQAASIIQFSNTHYSFISSIEPPCISVSLNIDLAFIVISAKS
jgi:hypothetical protein